MPDVVRIPANTLKDAVSAIGKLHSLVPVAKGQIAEVYVVLVCDTQKQAAYMEHARNGLRIRYLLDNVKIQSDIPRLIFCVEHSFFNAVKKDEDVVLTRNTGTQSLNFAQGKSKGTITLSPASSFLAPMMTPPTNFVKIPVDVVRTGLNATLFGSQDPSMTSGALSRVRMNKNELVVTTYDSMSGAVYRRSADELPAALPEAFDLTLPNTTMMSIIGQSDVPEMGIAMGANDFRFKTRNLDVVFPKTEHPIIPVEEHIKTMVENAGAGFTVDGKVLADAVATNATYLSVDKDAMNMSLAVEGNCVNVSVKSAKISHDCDVEVENFKGVDFHLHCDITRTQTFLRMVKSCGRITFLYESHRVFIKVPGLVLSFVES